MPIDSINPSVRELDMELSKIGVKLSDYTAILNEPSKMVLTFSEHLTRQVCSALQKDGLDYYLTKADMMSKGNMFIPPFAPKPKAKILSSSPVCKICIQGALSSVYFFALSLSNSDAL